MKFELTTEFVTNWCGTKLFRIKAAADFSSVKKGEKGGFIEKKENLSVAGDAWVAGNARVAGNAWVAGDAWVAGNARVEGNARVAGNAWVAGDAWVAGNARVEGDARVAGNAWVEGNADILWISRVGSTLFGTMTAFRNKEKKITIHRGCFMGTIAEFKKAVKSTHGKTKHATAYLKLADYISYHFNTLHKKGK